QPEVEVAGGDADFQGVIDREGVAKVARVVERGGVRAGGEQGEGGVAVLAFQQRPGGREAGEGARGEGGGGRGAVGGAGGAAAGRTWICSWRRCQSSRE